MTATSSVLGMGLLVAVIVAGGAGVHALQVSERLDQHLDTAVDRAVRDMSVRWLDVADAHGLRQDGAVEEVSLLVGIQGSLGGVQMEELVVRGPDGRVPLEVADAVRDDDGSLDRGRLDAGDLARAQLALPSALEPGGSTTLTIDAGEARPLTLVIGHPNTGGNGRFVELEAAVGY